MGVDVRNIQYLLKKYDTKQPGEIYFSVEMKQKMNNKKWRMSQKLRTCENICNRLNLKGTNKQRCYNIVRNINLKDLHRTCKCETILTAICFYVKKLENPKRNPNEYRVCKEFNLSNEIFSLIVCRLCEYYQKNSYLKL